MSGSGLLGLGSSPLGGKGVPTPPESKEELDGDAEGFDSAAADAFSALADKDEGAFKLALRTAIEAVLDERDG